MAENRSKILIVEDVENDAELLKRALSRAGHDFEVTRVENLKSLEATLPSAAWELIFSDFNLTDFNGFDVIRLAKKWVPFTPVIVVSGAVGEETAAELMRAGAKDFISKSNLSRLAPTVDRELAESRRQQRLHRLENQLKEAEHDLKFFVDSVKDHAVLMLDPEWRILGWNRGAEHVVGYEAHEVLGRSIEMLFPTPESRVKAAEKFRSVTAGRPSPVDGWTVRKDGSQFWASGSLTAMVDADGSLRRYALIFRDETERRRYQEELQLAKAKAESANLAKSQFLANMSHEIRTPLGVMLGFAEMIETGVGEAEAIAHARRILKNGRQLARIIDDVLDVSKVEANCIEIEKIEFSLREAVEDAIGTMAGKAEVKGLQIRARFAEKLVDRVVTDPIRLRQVLLNLLSNAIKFTESGEIEVEVAASKTPNQMQIRVKDGGRGISEAAGAKLFAPFMQGDVSVNRKYGGTGLGLYLSKRLCQALGGDLVLAHSTEGQGSTFEFTFESHLESLAEIGLANVAAQPAAPVAKARSLSGVRVLLVDDSADNRAIFSYFLQLAAADVHCAESGAEGLEKLSKETYDVVLLDIQMPEMDGYEAIGKIRAVDDRLPVLALTAHALESERQKCLRLGFDEHVTKPVDRLGLIEAVYKAAHGPAHESARVRAGQA